MYTCTHYCKMFVHVQTTTIYIYISYVHMYDKIICFYLFLCFVCSCALKKSISGDKYCRLCVVFIFHRYRFCLRKQRSPTTTEDAAGPHSFKYITIVINTLFFYNTIALKDSRNTSISTSVIFCTKQSLVTACSQLIATLGRHLPSYS